MVNIPHKKTKILRELMMKVSVNPAWGRIIIESDNMCLSFYGNEVSVHQLDENTFQLIAPYGKVTLRAEEFDKVKSYISDS